MARWLSGSPFGILETTFNMGYETGIGGPGWEAGSNRSGSRIFE